MKRRSPGAPGWIESIKVNRVRREIREGRWSCIKERRVYARPVLVAANLFFRAVRAPLRALANVAAWQRWEIDSFVLLHAPASLCAPFGRRGVVAEEFPGVNLTVTLDSGTLTEGMAAALGAELRRAHETYSAHFSGGWSHGDPHLGNFIYDDATDRAKIIDFEVRHRRCIGVNARHADDVLVVLQDMLGRSAAAQWLPCATAFIAGYGRPPVVADALSQLGVPPWMAAIWWSIRTSWIGRDEAVRRIKALRQNLDRDFPQPGAEEAESGSGRFAQRPIR